MRTIDIDKIIALSCFALLIIVLVWTVLHYQLNIPKCPNPADVIVGNGEYGPSTLYWSEYHCVSEQGFTREPKPRSGVIYPPGGSDGPSNL